MVVELELLDLVVAGLGVRDVETDVEEVGGF
jgi:hypothetical protein